MLLPQVLKRLFSRQPGRNQPDRERPPGADTAPARDGEEALQHTVEADKQDRPNTADR